MTQFTHLDWDSNFFGFKVCRINGDVRPSNSLKNLLDDLRVADYKLIYYSVRPYDKALNESAVLNGGFLADVKVRYRVDLNNIRQYDIPSENLRLDLLRPDDFLSTSQLALQSGVNSRFKVDPNFPDTLFEKMYKVWLEKSLTGQIADGVIGVRKGDEIVGMTTFKIDGNTGKIGLISVKDGNRGKGIAGMMLSKTFSIYKESKCQYAEVITQDTNIAACKLYEKYGYKQDFKKNVYHFWIKKKK